MGKISTSINIPLHTKRVHGSEGEESVILVIGANYLQFGINGGNCTISFLLIYSILVNSLSAGSSNHGYYLKKTKTITS